MGNPNNSKGLNTNGLNQTENAGTTVYWLLLATLTVTSAASIANTFLIAAIHWNQPILHWDSWEFVHRGGIENTFKWLFLQHNEHRIVWAKAATIIENEIFNVTPTKSALLQSAGILISCCICWTAICKQTIPNRKSATLSSLTGIAIITNPWQTNNLSWEFQTPWLMINLIVLCMAYILSIERTSIFFYLAFALLPWLAIFSTGQGIAALIAFTACSWIKRKKYGFLALITCGLPLYTYFILLSYTKPIRHPNISFDLHFLEQ